MRGFFIDMKTYLTKPEGLFTLSGIIFIVIALIPLPLNEKKLDIQVHDTYFIITISFLLVALGTALLFLSSIYLLLRLVKREMYKWPGYAHWLITAAFFVYVALLSMLDHSEYLKMHYFLVSYEFLNYFGILFLIAQSAFHINIIASIFLKGKGNKKPPYISAGRP